MTNIINTLDILKSKYLEKVDIYQSTKIHGLQENKYEIHKQPFWVHDIVEPLAKRLKEKTNAKKYEVLGPFGIGAHVRVYLDFNEEETKTLRITLTPGDLSKAEIRYLTNESTEQYKKGTLGYNHGLNFVTKELPSNLNDIIDLMQ